MREITYLTCISILGNICHPIFLIISAKWSEEIVLLYATRLYCSLVMVLIWHSRGYIFPPGWIVSLAATIYHSYYYETIETNMDDMMIWFWLWFVVVVIETTLRLNMMLMLIFAGVIPVILVAQFPNGVLTSLNVCETPSNLEFIFGNDRNHFNCMIMYPLYFQKRIQGLLYTPVFETVVYHTVFEFFVAFIMLFSDCLFSDASTKAEDEIINEEDEEGVSVVSDRNGNDKAELMTKPSLSIDKTEDNNAVEKQMCQKKAERQVKFIDYMMSLVEDGCVSIMTKILDDICAKQYDMTVLLPCDCDECKNDKDPAILVQIRENRGAFVEQLLQVLDDNVSEYSSSSSNNNNTRKTRLNTMNMTRESFKSMKLSTKRNNESVWSVVCWLDDIIATGTPSEALQAAVDKRRFAIDPDTFDDDSESEWSET